MSVTPVVFLTVLAKIYFSSKAAAKLKTVTLSIECLKQTYNQSVHRNFPPWGGRCVCGDGALPVSEQLWHSAWRWCERNGKVTTMSVDDGYINYNMLHINNVLQGLARAACGLKYRSQHRARMNNAVMGESGKRKKTTWWTLEMRENHKKSSKRVIIVDVLQSRWYVTCSAGWQPLPHTGAVRGLVSSSLPASPCPQHPAGQSHTGGSLTDKHTTLAGLERA